MKVSAFTDTPDALRINDLPHRLDCSVGIRQHPGPPRILAKFFKPMK